MKQANVRTMLFIVLLLIFVLACGSAPAAEIPEGTEEPQATAATGAPTESAPPTSAPITHNVIPVNLPEKQNGVAGDFNSSKVLETKGLIGGDRFTYGRFERPFNANAMDTYFPELDIVNTTVFQDDTWIYGAMTLSKLEAGASETTKYAIELDVNIDGKGDWLVISNKPESTEWSVASVRVHKDENSDVGGEMPALTDPATLDGNGFETVAFDQGAGNDPDTAWSRISPSDPNTIEFAVKRSAIGDPEKFLIGMWAGTNLIDAGLFDINDKYTHEQAGAADAGLEYYYPIKEVAELDNSCRMAVGFQPNGSEPGICPVPAPQQADPVPPGTSCPAGTVLICFNGNCFCLPLIFIPTDEPPR